MDNAAPPKIKRSFSIIPHGPDEVELRAGVWQSTSHLITDGSATGRLCALVTGLDGTTSLDALAARAGVDRAEVDGLVEYLRGLDAIEDGPGSALERYLDECAQPLRPARPPAAPTVRLLGDPELTGQLSHLLSTSDPKLAVDDATDQTVHQLLDDRDTDWLDQPVLLAERLAAVADWRDSVLVFAGSRVDPVRANVLNRVALHLGTPWIHGALDGPFVYIGPTFLPGATACYACFESRVLMNLTNADGYLRYKRAMATATPGAGPMPLLPALSALLVAHLALEAINLAHTGTAYTAGNVLGVYLPTWEFTVNEVLALPGCPACGPVSPRDDTSLYFDARAWLSDRD
jgi:bacteriocin biosynthesis cyclodehydratase domain-containing protein